MTPKSRWLNWLRRGALLLGAAALVLPWGLPASAAETKKFFYEYGRDKSAWYWKAQQDVGVDSPAPPPDPIPDPTGGRFRAPSPQRDDTLPVAVYRGEHDRMSAIQFDLFSRGVTPGSEISRFVFSIEEGTDRNEQPSVNEKEAKIQACRITEFFAGSSDPDEWEKLPEFDESQCAAGKRNASRDGAVWRFDLSEIAEAWGEDPFDNHGVMLLGDIPDDAGPRETWQVNLKIPARDRDPGPLDREDVDESKGTEDRVVVQMAFVPGPDDLPPLPPPTGGGGGFGGGGGGFGGGFASTTDFTSAGGFGDADFSSADTAAAPVDDALPPAQVAATRAPSPRFPAHVWALVPVALLALAAVRSVVLEPVGRIRPDGPIAAIRRRNAERRGGAIREVRDPLAVAWGASRRAVVGTGRRFAAAGRTVQRAVRSVGRR